MNLKSPRHLTVPGAKDPWRRFRAGLVVLVLVTAGGTAGYVALGLRPLDALYQTVITISTVGYREVGEAFGDRHQIFTLFLILFGAGTSLYMLSVLIETVFEGRLTGELRRRRMQAKISRMNDHVVLCGYGQVGRAIEDELVRAGEVVVTIDLKEPEHPPPADRHMVIGDATDDHVILRARLDRARTLIIALDSDVDNLYIALTARSINPDLFIVARANETAVIPKLRQVGVDRVVNPHEIGGAHMAALVSHPEVLEFLDVVMQHGELEVRLAETRITDRSAFAHRSLQDCAIRDHTGANVLAVRREGTFQTNLSRHFVILPGDLLISLGTPEQLAALGEQAR